MIYIIFSLLYINEIKKWHRFLWGLGIKDIQSQVKINRTVKTANTFWNNCYYNPLYWLFLSCRRKVYEPTNADTSHPLNHILEPLHYWDVKFGIQIGSDWPQMGQIWDILRTVSVHFGLVSQNVMKLILKSHRFAPFGAYLTQFGYQIWHH